MTHTLRYMVHPASPVITDAELDELMNLIPINDFRDEEKYEYNGNFIITKNLSDRDEALQQMCCGITHRDVTLASGEEIYFAFDYGH